MRFLSVDKLTQAGFIHGFSQKAAGNQDVNQGNPAQVEKNRSELLHELECEGWPIVTVKQIHSNKVVVFPAQDRIEKEGVQADAIVTRLKGYFVAVKTADCVPILVADTKNKVVAAVHAGWQGTLSRVTEAVLKKMILDFGSNPVDCRAVIGPAACGTCYEVKMDVIQKFEGAFGKDKFVKWKDPQVSAYLDLKGANRQQLISVGLDPANITVMPRCTIHENHLFYSNRIEGKIDPKKVGRMLAFIGVK